MKINSIGYNTNFAGRDLVKTIKLAHPDGLNLSMANVIAGLTSIYAPNNKILIRTAKGCECDAHSLMDIVNLGIEKGERATLIADDCCPTPLWKGLIKCLRKRNDETCFKFQDEFHF